MTTVRYRSDSTNGHGIGTCLSSLALLLALAACGGGDEVRSDASDTSVVTDSAGGHSASPEALAARAMDTSAAPSATSDTAPRAPALPARTPVADSARPEASKSVASSTRATRDTAPARRDTTRAPTSTARATPAQAAPTGAPPPQSAPPTQAPATQTAAAATPTTPTAQPQQAAQSAGQGTTASLEVSQAEYNGWKTFAVNCTRCHGEDAIGSAIAPSLLKSLQGSVNHQVFVETVTDGRPEKGMPAWRNLLSAQQIEDIWAYLKARSDGRLAAGRPRVRSGN